MNTIKNTSGLPDMNNQPRTRQQGVLPTAIKERLLGQIITGEPDSNALGSGASATVTLNTGEGISVLFTISDDFKRTILVSPDVALYVGSISEATHWPFTGHNLKTVPFMVFNDWGNTNNVNSVTRAVIYNDTGGTLDFIVVFRARIITNAVAGQDVSNV